MTNVTKSAMVRLPLYLHYLNSLDGASNISSGAIAKAVGYGEVQVRKDLASVSGTGKPKIGYKVEELAEHIKEALNCTAEKKAVIVGAGRLGRALLFYDGFGEYNLSLKAAFDQNVTEEEIFNGKGVYPVSELESYCYKVKPSIGIIAVPENSAQEVCDRLIAAGVKAIWSFAPTKLKVPPEIAVKEENMASSLAVLAAGL